MKQHAIHLAWFLSFTLAGSAFGTEEQIDMKTTFDLKTSLSSGRFEAQFVGDGFAITDKDGGKQVHVSSMPPVYRAAWTSDGQTLATIEHVAGGSDCVCFHFE